MSSEDRGSGTQLLRDREPVWFPELLVARLSRLLARFSFEEGKNRASGTHIIGRQAQIIATFSSIIVHTEESRSTAEKLCKYSASRHEEIRTCSVVTSRREVESLHPENTCNGDT